MEITKKNLSDGRQQLEVTVPYLELEKFLEPAAKTLSEENPLTGFRPGKAPYEVLKSQLGEMPLLQAAARLYLEKNLNSLLDQEVAGEIVGQPRAQIVKLAPQNELVFQATVEVLPELQLPDYQNLAIKQEPIKIEVDKAEKILQELREAKVKEVLASRPAQNSDKVLLDIAMFLDSVPLEGGQSSNTSVIIGKNYLVPGFDQEILGLSKNDSKTFSLIYPADHYQHNLAGKPVEFKVTVKEVYERQLPAADDELAKGFGIDSLQQLRSNINHNLEQEAKFKAEEEVETAMLDALLLKTDFEPLPQTLIHGQAHQMLHELEHYVERQGGKFIDYLRQINKSEEDLVKEFEPNALRRVKTAMLLRAIAKKENIIANPEEITAEIKRLSDYYQEEPEIVVKINSSAYQRELQNQITVRKTVEWLKARNTKYEI